MTLIQNLKNKGLSDSKIVLHLVHSSKIRKLQLLEIQFIENYLTSILEKLPNFLKEDNNINNIKVVDPITFNICPNCKEPTETKCGCYNNICRNCKEPIGNIAYTVCDKCFCEL